MKLCGRKNNGLQNLSLFKSYLNLLNTTTTNNNKFAYIITIYDKRSFEDVIKDLKMGRLSWVVWWSQSNHKNPCKWKTEAEFEVFRYSAVGFENGERGHSSGMQVTSRSQKRQGNHSPLDPLEGMHPCQHHDFSQVKCNLNFWPPERHLQVAPSVFKANSGASSIFDFHFCFHHISLSGSHSAVFLFHLKGLL